MKDFSNLDKKRELKKSNNTKDQWKGVREVCSA